ncbi:MAG: 50S ribosomal protein L21 [Bacteroidetes bacterium]|nr:50S ribosomal protein L21 [Bacteroidota bacterium]MCW5895733.1 50S ribosomal protein L21 [Bacteroidota bacterium]
MYAVVDIAGKQFKVAPNDKLHVPTLKADKGATISFDKVLLLAGDKEVSIGNPTVSGASVEATVLDHMKDDKVVVFKKKKRKGYRVKRGHRQAYTQVQITKIGK